MAGGQFGRMRDRRMVVAPIRSNGNRGLTPPPLVLC